MNAWRDSAGRLATFAFANLVNRDDRFGRYRPIERRESGKCLVERSPVTLELLERHFRGEDKHDLIGLHVVSKDGTCRWVALDFDNHDGCGQSGCSSRDHT